MRLKTITAETMAAAMKRVRAEFGDDAIIVSSVEVVGGVEIVAAMEPADEAQSLADATLAEDVLDALQNVLDYHRVPARLSEALDTAARDIATNDAVLALAGALDSVFAFSPISASVVAEAKPLMLVGPPGAGKTVTAAKLAARLRLARRMPALITTDVLRTGAVEQIAGYAGVIGIPHQVAQDTASLKQALEAAQGAALRLIDTTGVNPFDEEDMERLAAYAATAGAEPVLVLPAGMDPEEAGETAAAFAAIGTTRLIVTRLDTARRVGGLLSSAGAGRLRFADVGTGPHLADGLAPLNPLALARLLAAAPADRVATLAPDYLPSYAESAS